MGVTDRDLCHCWGVLCAIAMGASKRGKTEGAGRVTKSRFTRFKAAGAYFFNREASYSSFNTRWSRASSSTVRDFSLMLSSVGSTVWV